MSTNNDLRAVCQNVLSKWSSCSGYGLLAKELRDRLDAEHPVDDGEAITEDWLRKIGFRSSSDGVLTMTIEDPVADQTHVIWSIDFWQGHLCEWWYCAVQRLGQDCDRIAWPHSKTRRDVRRLIGALKGSDDAH